MELHNVEATYSALHLIIAADCYKDSQNNFQLSVNLTEIKASKHLLMQPKDLLKICNENMVVSEISYPISCKRGFVGSQNKFGQIFIYLVLM